MSRIRFLGSSEAHCFQRFVSVDQGIWSVEVEKDTGKHWWRSVDMFSLVFSLRLFWRVKNMFLTVKEAVEKNYYSKGSMKYIPVVIGNALSIGIRLIACFAPHESE